MVEHRSPKPGVAGSIPATPATLRQEVSKVTWASRKETGVGTMMVFIMVTLASIFFFLVDGALSWGVKFILGLGA